MLTAQIKDGQIVESASQNSLKATGDKSGMDKDSFLQLLVAQMKYQDPLEPTSNTEYISQYAQFSQVEQMQNMAGSMSLQRASALVGQEVYIETTDSTGKTTAVQGRVDYVTYEKNKAYLSVNGALYSMDDLKQVTDKEYQQACEKVYDFVVSVNKLPALEYLTLGDSGAVESIEETYDALSAYEKTFVAKEVTDKVAKYLERLKELKAGAAKDDSQETEQPEET